MNKLSISYKKCHHWRNTTLVIEHWSHPTFFFVPMVMSFSNKQWCEVQYFYPHCCAQGLIDWCCAIQLVSHMRHFLGALVIVFLVFAAGNRSQFFDIGFLAAWNGVVDDALFSVLLWWTIMTQISWNLVFTTSDVKKFYNVNMNMMKCLITSIWCIDIHFA